MDVDPVNEAVSIADVILPIAPLIEVFCSL